MNTRDCFPQILRMLMLSVGSIVAAAAWANSLGGPGCIEEGYKRQHDRYEQAADVQVRADLDINEPAEPFGRSLP